MAEHLEPSIVSDEYPVGWGEWPPGAKASYISQRMARRTLADAIRNMVGLGEDPPTDRARLSHEELAATYLALKGDL